jgi:hypothetical protein
MIVVSEKGPPILITADDFEYFEDHRTPFGNIDAYVWIGIYGPVRAKYSWLARQWRWKPFEVRNYIYKMVGAGLLKLDGKSILAVALDDAVPAPIEGSWTSLRSAVFARDGHACTYCGSAGNLQCDHIYPRAKGGTDALDNLTTACQSCNASKRDRLLSEWKR